MFRDPLEAQAGTQRCPGRVLQERRALRGRSVITPSKGTPCNLFLSSGRALLHKKQEKKKKIQPRGWLRGAAKAQHGNFPSPGIGVVGGAPEKLKREIPSQDSGVLLCLFALCPFDCELQQQRCLLTARILFLGAPDGK